MQSVCGRREAREISDWLTKLIPSTFEHPDVARCLRGCHVEIPVDHIIGRGRRRARGAAVVGAGVALREVVRWDVLSPDQCAGPTDKMRRL